MKFFIIVFLYLIFSAFFFNNNIHILKLSINPGDFETSSSYIGDKNITFKLYEDEKIIETKELPLDRYNLSLLGFKNGFIEYSFPLIVEDVKSITFTFQVLPYKGNFSSFDIFVNENYIDKVKVFTNDDNNLYKKSILVKLQLNDRGIFLNNKRVLPKPISELIPEDEAYVDLKIFSKDGIFILGNRWGNYKQDINIELKYKGDKVDKVKIKDILDKPLFFENKNVLLECRYAGWAILPKNSKIKRGNLPFTLSRSAVCVFDDTGMIYIKRPIIVVGHIISPPFKPKWEHLVIYGKVLLDKEKNPYIVDK